MQPKVVLFDEATTMLDPAGRRMALDWMLKLHRDSMTVVYITHHMEEATLASRVIVLNEGQVALDGAPEDVFSDAQTLSRFGLGLPRPARFAMRFEPWLGKLVPRPLLPEDWLMCLPQYKPVPIQQKTMHKQNYQIASHEKLIEVHELEHVYMADTPLAHMALNHLNLTGFCGVTLGLLGRTGSGKSTLLQHLNGLLRPQKGSVRVGPFVMEDPQTLTQSVAKLVGLVFQNPEMQFFEQYSGDEISFGPRQIGIEEALADRVRWAMKLAGLDFDAFKNRLVYTLSGGEKRKVALAATLAMRPKVLLLDEPTAGLDPAAHLEILGRLAALQSEGMTIVLSSHRMNDLAALSQRLAIFDKGRVIREGQTGDVFWDFNGLAKAGLEPPLIVQTVARLRELGWLLPIGIVTPDQLEIALQNCCQVPGQNEVTT